MTHGKKLILSIAFLLAVGLPSVTWATEIVAKVFENGANGEPVPVAGVKLEAFSGYHFRGLVSSGVTSSKGQCLLRNLPLGREILVKLSAPGYLSQYDLRIYSSADVEDGAAFWIAPASKIEAFCRSLGEAFDPARGHVYLEVVREETGEGIEGIQLSPFSGKAFDLGHGEYLIANAEAPFVTIGMRKPGYSFDIESVEVPLFQNGMTQVYVKLQSGGAIYSSGQAVTAASACVSGFIRQLSTSAAIADVTVAFTRGGATWRPSVVTGPDGFYVQCDFPVGKTVKVTPSKSPWKFKPRSKYVKVLATGGTADFYGR